MSPLFSDTWQSGSFPVLALPVVIGHIQWQGPLSSSPQGMWALSQHADSGVQEGERKLRDHLRVCNSYKVTSATFYWIQGQTPAFFFFFLFGPRD